MAMTKRDYVLLAEAFSQAYDSCKTLENEEGVDAAVAVVATALVSTSPLFNTGTFVMAATRARLSGTIESIPGLIHLLSKVGHSFPTVLKGD